MKGLLIKPFTKLVALKVKRDSQTALESQKRIFKHLIRDGRNTVFGDDHGLKDTDSYATYSKAVPVRDYEGLKSYFDRIVDGQPDVLWPGKPVYLAKTSGTTSGTKYIPITRNSLPNHINTARNALFNYASKGRRTQLFNGKVMFLSGSPELNSVGGIPTGRLSGIVNHEIPGWLQGNQMPTFKTNCLDDWENKVDQIVEETSRSDMRLISGIPPWVQMYFERLLEKTGKSRVIDVFPNLQLFMHGGVNYAPYADAMRALLGGDIDTLETYPASEGFIAFQDSLDDDGLLLNTNSGIFYEFIPLTSYFAEHPERLSLDMVELGIDYAVIITSNAGLWAYSLGDTVRFTSKNPYRLEVTGRVKHFISAFGEHVIAKEVEEALLGACSRHDIRVREFTVAPQVSPPEGGLPYHEWFVEFEGQPNLPDNFAQEVDELLRQQNAYYDDLLRGKILKCLVIRPLATNAFRVLMKSRGKLGGQNKVPRLSNDRHIGNTLYEHGLILNT